MNTITLGYVLAGFALMLLLSIGFTAGLLTGLRIKRGTYQRIHSEGWLVGYEFGQKSLKPHRDKAGRFASKSLLK